MVIILPFAYLSIFLAIGNSRLHTDWRHDALRAALVWMAVLVALTEIFSLVNAVRPWPLFFGWLIPVAMGGWILFKRWQVTGRVDLPRPTRPENWLAWVQSGGILFFLAISAVVAFLAPPNTYDSLNYHMARVAHWAQDGSIRHFATGVDIHNSNTPGAEIAMLAVYVLSASDRFVNFVAWAASLGSAVGAAYIAAKFGANRNAQLLAAVFVVTIPMGIAQASSSMNDYVVAFWLVCAAAEIISFEKGGQPIALIFAALAAGGAFLTKATSTAYLIPLGIWMTMLAFRRLKMKQILAWGAAGLGLAMLLNAGFVIRNIETYHYVVDPVMSKMHSNQLRTWQGVTSNLIRTLGQQLGTPFPKLNAAEYLAIAKIHEWMELDINDPRTTSIGIFRISLPNYNELRINNPLHAFLILAAFVIMLIKIKKFDKPVLIYSLMLFSGLAVYSYLFKWQIFGNRLHLSFFVLFAPAMAYVFGTFKNRFNFCAIISLALLISSLPWLFHIESRPLLPTQFDGYFSGKTLFDTPRPDWYFAGIGSTPSSGERITDIIKQSGCNNVGMMISGSSAEYQYWALLGAPRNDLHIEWLVTGPSERYRDLAFQPCAVICEGCTANADPYHLPLALESDGIRLFILQK
jgi:hypothetical protein